MAEEGRPTGITHGDVNRLGIVDFEGRQAQLVRSNLESHVGTGHTVLLELDLGDEHLVLWGYFSGDEFMEVRRERLD